jgi:hypothetical protein
MGEGGDRGKSPNKTGTQPAGRVREKPDTPGSMAVRGGPGRGAAGSKHAADAASGVKTSETRKAGPRKTPAKTTTRSGDK